MSEKFLKDIKDTAYSFVDDMDDITKFGEDTGDTEDVELLEVDVFSNENQLSQQNTNKIFSDITSHTSAEDEEVMKLLRDGIIPEKKVVNRMKSTKLGISLAQLSLAKKLAGKLSIIENYLSLLENKLFDEKNIKAMSMEDTLSLYQSTRILFEKTNDMLMKITEKVDVDSIEMEIKTIGILDDDISLDNTEDLDDIMKYIKDRKKTNAE